MKRALLLGALLLGTANAADVKFRPQGAELQKALLDALAAISTKELPITLDNKSGPLLVLGGGAAFNPDVVARTVVTGGERRIEFNPKGPLPLAEAVRRELARELGMKDWSVAAARTELSGADINGDGVIDLTDLALLMSSYGKSGTKGDLNQDQKVDDADLRIFSEQYRP